jgi:hypothetical protein
MARGRSTWKIAVFLVALAAMLSLDCLYARQSFDGTERAAASQLAVVVHPTAHITRTPTPLPHRGGLVAVAIALFVLAAGAFVRFSDQLRMRPTSELRTSRRRSRAPPPVLRLMSPMPT